MPRLPSAGGVGDGLSGVVAPGVRAGLPSPLSLLASSPFMMSSRAAPDFFASACSPSSALEPPRERRL